MWVSDNHIEWTMPQIRRCGRANTHARFDREGMQELAVNTHSRYGVNNKTKSPDKKHRHPTSIFFLVLFSWWFVYRGKGTKTSDTVPVLCVLFFFRGGVQSLPCLCLMTYSD